VVGLSVATDWRLALGGGGGAGSGPGSCSLAPGLAALAPAGPRPKSQKPLKNAKAAV
jgi:hypothetical protein